MNYKDKRWIEKRRYILKRDGYICQEFKRYGKVVSKGMNIINGKKVNVTLHVHHIYPVEVYPELKYENWNLITLSNVKHNEMHDRVTKEITNKGMYWQRKRRKDFAAWKEKQL